jgi:ketosteroid isomerase-like protein
VTPSTCFRRISQRPNRKLADVAGQRAETETIPGRYRGSLPGHDQLRTTAPEENLVSDLQAIVDRFEIEALRGEFTDAVMTRDFDRFAALFTEDGAWRIPYINVELVGREQIRAGFERMQGLWEYFVQTSHPGTIEVDGDCASGRAYLQELGRMRDGRSEMNFAVYHDRLRRTPDGWRFTERVYEIRYLDTSPLAGAPDVPGGAGFTTPVR